MPSQLPTGKVVPHPVAGVDLIPTFFRFANIDLPWKMHGHDLTPLLKNPDSEWKHPALTSFTARSYGADTNQVPADTTETNINGIPWYFMLRENKYKYIRYTVEGETEELYDLDADPEELTNLAMQPELKDQLLAMRTATIAELKRTGAGIVDNLPKVAGQ